MVTSRVKVLNKKGIHLRLASEIVNAASKFRSTVLLARDELEVNAKSMLGVAMLGAEFGVELVLNIEGEDEKEALETMTALFKTNFGKEDI